MRVVLAAVCALSLSSTLWAQSVPLPTNLRDAAKNYTPPTGKQAPVLPVTPAPPPPPPAPPPVPATTVNVPEVGAVNGWNIIELVSGRRRPDGTPTAENCGYERDVVVTRTTPEPAKTPAVLVVGCDAARAADGSLSPLAPTLRLPPPWGPAPGAVVAGAGDDLQLGVKGGLVVDDVFAAITPLRPAIADCHRTLGGPAGRLVMRVVVSANGVVTETSSLEGSLKGTTLDTCVADVLRGLKLPQTRDGEVAVVSAAFTFAQTGPGLAPEKAKPKLVAAVTYRACGADEEPEIRNGEPTCSVVVTGRMCAPGEAPKPKEQLAAGEAACVEDSMLRRVPFHKGELTQFGDVQMVNARTSFGVGLGLAALDGVYYGVLRPDVNLKFGRFSLGLGAPLRFELANLNNVDVFGGDPLGDATANLGRFRTEDWDQLEDFVRPLRYLTFGKKEDELYIDVNRVHAITLGHGQLMRRYQPNLDIDEDNLFAEVDAYGDFGGVEFMTGPFPLPRLVGGLAFIKPLSFINAVAPIGDDGSYLRQVASTFSIGGSYVADLNSPTGLEQRLNPVDNRPQLVVDGANQFLWKNRDSFTGAVVQGFGIDTEVKVLKLDAVDIKLYGDWSRLVFPSDVSTANAFSSFKGDGYTVGGLLRVSLGETPIRPIDQEDEETKAGRKPRQKKAAHAFRVRLEGRTFEPTFLPSYFNTMYEVDRFQFGFSDSRVTLPTKMRYLADQASDPWRVGYYAEASYAWVDVLGVTAAFEDAIPLGGDQPVRGKNLAVHVESQGLGWLQLFATYHFRNFETAELNKAFSLDSDNEIMFVGGRLQVLPIMFINVSAQRAFRLGFSQDDVTGANDEGLRFTSVGLNNAWASGLDVELGWQF